MKTDSRIPRFLLSTIESLMGQEDLGQVLRGAGVAMVIRSTAMVLNYLILLLLARWMGAFDFGLYAFAITLVTLLALPATLGLGIASVKFIPSYLARTDRTALRSLLRRSTGLVFFSSAIIAMLAAGVIRIVMPESPYTDVTLLAVMALPLWAFVSLFSDVSRGFGWITIAYAPAQLGVAVLTLVAAAGLMGSGRLSAINLVLGTILAYGVVVLIQVALLGQRLWPDLKGRSNDYRTREWIYTGVPLLLFLGSYLVIIQTDILMVGAFHGPDGVGHYAAAARTAMLVLFVQGVVSNLAEPHFARYATEDRRRDLQLLSARLLPWTFCVSLLITLPLLGAGYWILGMFGNGFVAGYGPLCILVIAYLAQSALGLLSGLLNMTGAHRACATAHLVGAVGNIVLNAILIPVFGINGAALATATTVVLVNLWLLFLVRRRLGVDPSVMQFWPAKRLSSLARTLD
jgi:O-antigen/teichoic acid export membrane protein